MRNKIKDRVSRMFRTPNASPTSTAPASATASRSSIVETQERSLPQDLWQFAYDQLGQKEREILSRVQIPALPINDAKDTSRTEAILNSVIRITEEQYEKYQQGGIKIQRSTGENINIRQYSQKIINAALSFKDIISAVVAFDPTHHAASAWAVVSLGLTVSQSWA